MSDGRSRMEDRQSSGQATDRQPSDRADVCIIGSGPAGALVADVLAQRNYSVVILEAGERFSFETRLERMERALRPEHSALDVWDMGGPRDAYTCSDATEYPLNELRVKGVGGSTLHWQGMVMRLHEKDFEMESRYGLASDWPLSYADLRPYYATAERELGVAGAEDNPFAPPRQQSFPMEAFPRSYSNTLFADACEDLDVRVHSVPQARNSEPYDDRSTCVGYSTCSPVCPSGAKYSADVHVEKAEQQGARVIDRVPVQRLEHDDDGNRVTGATYVTPDGETHRQEARQFVVACGGVETPRLLLLSKSEQYPDGLANSSGLVGRYFMEHPFVSTTGVLGRQANQNPIGFHTMESHQFYDYEDPAPGSIKLEFLNAMPTSPLYPALRGGDESADASLVDPLTGDEWGNALAESIRDQHVENRVQMGALVEQLPRKRHAVTLDPTETDAYGNPVPNIDWGLGSFERKTMKRAAEIQREILSEMGATQIESQALTAHGVGHQMGTTRMGSDPDESVVDARLRTHDLDNLSLVSSGAFVTPGAMNPTLTIAALALKAADHVREDL